SFAWHAGPYSAFRIIWSGDGHVYSGKGFDLTGTAYTPSDKLWTKILNLGAKSADGLIRWGVTSQYPGVPVPAVTNIRSFKLAPPEAPVTTEPPPDSSFSASAPPPSFAWEANHNSRY